MWVPLLNYEIKREKTQTTEPAINPETGKVKRIYLVKNPGKNKILQLTWLGDRSCRTTTIIEPANGNSYIEKEEKITWSFDTP